MNLKKNANFMRGALTQRPPTKAFDSDNPANAGLRLAVADKKTLRVFCATSAVAGQLKRYAKRYMLETIYNYKNPLFVGAIVVTCAVAISVAIFFGINIEPKSLAPILISITALAVSIYSVFRDSSNIEIGWDMCCNNDSSEQWIDIQVINRGRRPVLVQSVGYFDIAMGSYICADNKSPNDIIQPATMKNYKEKMKFKDMWKVGELFIIDENGKRWSNSKYSRRAFIRMAANCPYDGKHISRTKEYPKYLDKIHKKYLKQIGDSPNKKDIEMKLSKSREFYLKDHA